MYSTCRECGATVENGDLCLYCKSKKSHCKLDKFGYKEMSIPVPWCFEKDTRVLLKNMKWLCDDCEYSERRR